MSLLDKRVIFVTGKGGTGKTTVAVALGLWAARNGRSTLLVECQGARHIAPLFRQASSGYTPAPLHPGLAAMSISAQEAIEDYVVQQIKVRRLYSLVFKNRVMGPFMDAVPGLHNAVHLGKIYDLSLEENSAGDPIWDLIIVDAPATGHGLHMLASAGSMMELTRAGPVYEGVKKVHELISDPSQTGLVLTCLPEELPVNETIALYTQLRKANHDVSAVVLNETIHMDLPDSASWSQIRPSIAAHPNQSISGLAELTDRWLGQLRHQREARLKLKAVIDATVLDLPMLADRRVGFSELEQLSEILAQHLSTP